MRFEAAEMFRQRVRPPEVARRLRVTRKSAYAWHADWRQGGSAALESRGAGGFPCRLDDAQTLITTARRQLDGAPLILVWDNASTHQAKPLREFCDRNRDWLTIVKLPPYASDLNPVEGVWAHLKKSPANLAPHKIEDLTPLVKNRLRGIQRRPEVLNGFIAETGLTLEPP
ncbi:transposase [Streptomyces sp. NPDC091215]|uniref:transposase n=1 Tax=Streptomyces sp. NPDC091215 TaxID=3155192 RepID=UPI003436B170